MFTAALLLFANTLLFSLRLSGTGSFPKPLSAAEEQEYLQRYAKGDQEARDILIERNLRLVAHIIKQTTNPSVAAVQSYCQAQCEWMAITGIWTSSMRPVSCCLHDTELEMPP